MFSSPDRSNTRHRNLAILGSIAVIVALAAPPPALVVCN
jgi:hypothetical protein